MITNKVILNKNIKYRSNITLRPMSITNPPEIVMSDHRYNNGILPRKLPKSSKNAKNRKQVNPSFFFH